MTLISCTYSVVDKAKCPVYTLSSSERFKVNKIIKGGSLGHGTAVPGHYDIDLVVYSEGRQYIYLQKMMTHCLIAPQ